MTTRQVSDVTGRTARQKWVVPVTAVVIGVAYLVAGLAGGEPGFAWGGLAVMVAVAVGTLLAARRSETVAGLLDRRDERINGIDLEATAVAGGVVLAAAIAGFVVEIARGQDGEPYSWLGALGGLSYVAALAWFRLRR